MLVTCSKCDQEWAQDPARQVACPRCPADVGQPCERPSGHPAGLHAARYHRDFSDRFDSVAEHFDVAISDQHLLKLSDAPPWVQRNGDKFSRIGIEQRGRAHYYCKRDDHVLVLLLDDQPDFVDGCDIDPKQYRLGEHLRYVGQNTGWAEIDPSSIPTIRCDLLLPETAVSTVP